MRIQCSSCNTAVKVRTNANGEVNCPHCGAGLLVMSSLRNAEIDQYTDQPRGDVTVDLPPQSNLVPIVLFAIILAVIGAVAIAAVLMTR